MVRTTEVWQLRYTESLAQPRIASLEATEQPGAVLLVGGRRNGRGPWLTPTDMPRHVLDYACAWAKWAPLPNGARCTEFTSLDALRQIVEEGRPTDGTPGDRVMRSPPGLLQVLVRVDAPRGERRPPKVTMRHAVTSLPDLAHRLGVAMDAPVRALYRSIYNATECGAHLSLAGTYQSTPASVYAPGTHLTVYEADGRTTSVPLADADGMTPAGFTPETFQFGSIVEGSDVNVDGTTFWFGRCRWSDVLKDLKTIEEEVAFYWEIGDRDNLALYAVRPADAEDDGTTTLYVQCGWGEYQWDTTDEDSAPLRATFEAWYDAQEEVLDEGETTTLPDGTIIERKDRSDESLS